MFNKILPLFAVIVCVGFATRAQAQTVNCAGTMSVTINGSSSGVLLSATSAITSNYNGQQIKCNDANQTTDPNGKNNGQVTVTATGGTPTYEYAISADGGVTWSAWQVSSVFNLLDDGIAYSFKVKDSNTPTGCEYIIPGSQTLVEPQALVGGVCITFEDLCQLNQGAAQIDVTGGTGVRTLSWTTTLVPPFAGPASPGLPVSPTTLLGSGVAYGSTTITTLSGNTIYAFTITDANGCYIP